MGTFIIRHYHIKSLTFDQFLQAVTVVRTAAPFVKHVHFELKYIENLHKENLRSEDPEKVRRKLSKSPYPVRKFEAWLASHAPGKCPDIAREHKSIRIAFRAIATQRGDQVGLSLSTDDLSKLDVYRLERRFLADLPASVAVAGAPVMGEPCEVLAVVVDMRDFTNFYEAPRVESPYVSGLLTSFYELMTACFDAYPPDSIKFLGDGMLALWRTRADDRDIASATALAGLQKLNSEYREFRKRPSFVHGTPENLGAGVAYGLASKMAGLNDFIGRPIILASRLCAVCPGGSVLVEKGFPGVDAIPKCLKESIDLKSLGPQEIVRIPAAENTS